MNAIDEKSLIEQAKQNVSNKATSLGDAEHKVAIKKYCEQGRFDVEVERLFKRLPSPLLHSSSLQEADSFQSVDSILGSLIVSRDSEGKAHIFRNSCRHRGARLVDGKQCQKHIVCPYHAWSYATDGQLSILPAQQQCFPTLDKTQNGLLVVPSVEKYGFIWACPLATDIAEAEAHLDDYLGDMAGQLDWMAAGNLKVFQNTSKIWQGNWKLFAEGGLETYHFAFAHKQTIASSFYNNIAVIDQINKHFRVMMPTRELKKGDPQSIHDCSHTLFSLLPGPAFLVQKDHVDWINIKPLTPGKSEISITTLIPKDADLGDPQQLNHWQKNHHITNVTLDEDWALGETIQQSINERALPYIQYGKNEWALHAFGELIEAELGLSE